tara:strand:+ start:512 stop:904 length:393 start_codon:yes stop_codon:yes gene_type:complete
MERKIVTEKSKLFSSTESKIHYVKVAQDSKEHLKVWVKEPTFLQLEQAQMKMFNINMASQEVDFDVSEVYRYLFEAFIEKTDPKLTPIDLIRLNPYVGNQIKSILPDPFTVMDGDDNLKVNLEEQLGQEK